MYIRQFLLLSFDVVLLICGLGLLIPCLVLFIECMAALFPSSEENTRENIQNAKVAVLVPAHNEELIIRSTLMDLKVKLQNKHQLLVVADNCTDTTAEIARTVGATVIERNDLNNLGKGYALDYGLRFLQQEPPEVVVFMDADCFVQQGSIEKLAQLAITKKRPVQATYLMSKPALSSPKDSVSAFAFKVKNQVRLLGLKQLRLPCTLVGTGMAFPWGAISSVNLASGDIVEDMKLGLDLNIDGYPPLFCPSATVIGCLPQQTQAAISQRTRWEHGHLQTLLTYVPKLIKASVKQKRIDLLGSALDLSVPPLSLLVTIWLLLMIASLFVAFMGINHSAILIGAIGYLLMLAILTAWFNFGRKELPLLQLLSIPIYIVNKIPVYLQFIFKPVKIWVRTERDSVNT
ncbi:MAG: glycosyltransferase [Cyanobacteria bacterium P01_D01_bin.50]